MNLLAEPLERQIEQVKDNIRREPQATSHRFALASLMVLRGEYEQALKQLQALALLDQTLVMNAQMLRLLIRAERVRQEVFAGAIRPLVLGEPEPWLGIYIQALTQSAEDAAALRQSVIEQLPAIEGRAGEKSFAWICDGDSRLGPCFEIILDGQYYWVPVNQISRIEFSSPSVALDLVWAPIRITLANGGSQAAYMPARYPEGSNDSVSDDILLGRRTDWNTVAPESWHGSGRRTWIADGEDVPVFSVDALEFQLPADAVK